MKISRFKGQRLDNKEWVYGNLVISDGKICRGSHYIIPELNSIQYDNEESTYELGAFYKVISKTVCQFTNLYDIYGHDIYENDICMFKHLTSDLKGFIRYNDNAGYFEIVTEDSDSNIKCFSIENCKLIQKVGNIYDCIN